MSKHIVKVLVEFEFLVDTDKITTDRYKFDPKEAYKKIDFELGDDNTITYSGYSFYGAAILVEANAKKVWIEN